MNIELLTKEEIKQIKEFPNDIRNKLNKFMSPDRVNVIMEIIKFNTKEDIKFLTEFNKQLKFIKENKFKLTFFTSSYIIKKEVLDKESIDILYIGNYEDSLKCKAYMYLFNKFIGKKYNKEIAHKQYKSWLLETIHNNIEDGGYKELFLNSLYLDSYKRWLLLIDSLMNVLVFNNIVKVVITDDKK